MVIGVVFIGVIIAFIGVIGVVSIAFIGVIGVVFIAAITGVIGNDRGGGRASCPPPRLAAHSHGSVFFSFARLLVSSLAIARVDMCP